MNRVCKPYLDKFVIVFIDDILIYSKSKEDYEVYLKFSVGAAEEGKVVCLIEAVKNWKVPKTPSGIRSFLELAGYYRRFIVNFSKIAKPLASLTQKIQKYEWAKEQEEAFQTLKDNLCRERDNRNAAWPGPTNGKEGRWRVEVGDKVMLEVSSWKDVLHFGKKDLLAPRYYWTDANLHVHVEEIKVDKTLRFAEEPVEIIDREVKS
ncbi:hypothetical protein Tco_1132073 [Tanacetum coccineum]|uniref:Reverse transcriptase domain-containing protein n=1 Tax=Tanacetum coccineum TaxID=301880 RepID=A0ABQ5JDN6_9ASTR